MQVSLISKTMHGKDIATIIHNKKEGWIPTVDDYRLIKFSKIVIHQVPTIRDWGITTSTVRFLLSFNNKKYNFAYYDLISSFHNIFFFQNDNYKHIWWIRLEPSILEYKKDLPMWFYY
ncbi:hypothetical protein ACH5RR_017936 [Cinchona calisaya]|uniref:Uncharacterized protein n=1 Tax=Cinchona calisaya TaxID=153742 RepID=A0ABD2ZMX0_9GENT